MTGSTTRQRLIEIAQAYTAAFIAGDFRQLRFAPNLRNTENGIDLPVGVGAARTAISLRDGGQFFVDTATSQVEYWGVLDQLGGEVIYGVRLRIEGVLIADVETLLVANTDPYYFPDVVRTYDGGFHDPIHEGKRLPRAALVEIANRYFDGIEQNDGTLVPVAKDCLRLVNGAHDTVTDVSELGASEAHRALSVQAQMTGGHYAYIEALRGRRFPIVDEERGIVLAHVLFDHPGDINKPDGAIIFGKPNTMNAFEAFKVVGGQVTAVWAICHTLPYGMPSGWGPGEPRHAISLP